MAFVLSFSEVGFRTAISVRGQRSVSYAADGATEIAINAMRGSSADCPATYPTLSPSLNNTPVQVSAEAVDQTTTCKYGLSGVNTTLNTPGKSLLALPAATEGGIVQGSNSTLNIGGDIFSGTTI